MLPQGARAGEAEADVAVGIGAWALKSGPPSHATIGKLNRLILIEEQLAQMQEAAQVDGRVEEQVAHLVTWEQVYEAEEQALAAYAEEAENAAEGP